MIREKNKKNKFFIVIYIFLVIIFLCPLPYYIEKDGGLISTADRVKIENTSSSNNFYMAYVSEIKVNIFTYIISLFNKDWTLIPKKDVVYTNETEAEEKFRSKLLLNESIDNAIISAFKLANKNINIKSEEYYVTYIDEIAETDMKIQDKIIKINNIDIKSKEDIKNIIKNLKPGDSISIDVINNEKTYKRTAKLIDIDGQSVIGVLLTSKKEIETIPKITNEFKNSESGSSGGLMLALEIYNNLTDNDISKGRKIAGTGTIDENGNIGQISGVKYKLRGAYKEGATVFLVPSGENYEIAIKVAAEEKLNIEILEVSTLKDAIIKLEG